MSVYDCRHILTLTLLGLGLVAGCQADRPQAQDGGENQQQATSAAPSSPVTDEPTRAQDRTSPVPTVPDGSEVQVRDSKTPEPLDTPPPPEPGSENVASGEASGQNTPPKPPVPVEEWPFFKQVVSQGGKVTLLDRATGNIWLAVTPEWRAVAVLARVVLRRGILEHLMCLAHTKEHEAILAAELTPEVFHAALIAAGAEPGSPVQYDPEFRPPSGTKLVIQLEWWDGQQWQRVPARSWIVEDRTGKPFQMDWVFAGSKTIKHPTTGQDYYLGREGDLITVANMVSAVIDVAGYSSASNESLLFRAKEEAIPPLDTPVLVILRPAGEHSKKASSESAPSEQPSDGE